MLLAGIMFDFPSEKWAFEHKSVAKFPFYNIGNHAPPEIAADSIFIYESD